MVLLPASLLSHTTVKCIVISCTFHDMELHYQVITGQGCQFKCQEYERILSAELTTMEILQTQESLKVWSSIKQQTTFARMSICRINWHVPQYDLYILRTWFSGLSFREASKIIRISLPVLIPVLTANEDFISKVFNGVKYKCKRLIQLLKTVQKLDISYCPCTSHHWLYKNVV